jgi:hypothetical protein
LPGRGHDLGHRVPHDEHVLSTDQRAELRGVKGPVLRCGSAAVVLRVLVVLQHGAVQHPSARVLVAETAATRFVQLHVVYYRDAVVEILVPPLRPALHLLLDLAHLARGPLLAEEGHLLGPIAAQPIRYWHGTCTAPEPHAHSDNPHTAVDGQPRPAPYVF